jgi:hypothetical protein
MKNFELVLWLAMPYWIASLKYGSNSQSDAARELSRFARVISVECWFNVSIKGWRGL